MKHTIPLIELVTEKQRKRFYERIGPEDKNGCMNWCGGTITGGYGSFCVGRRCNNTLTTVGAHRVAYELGSGPIGAGLCVCHHCDNPRCCNLNHLFLGTHADNAADRDRKGRGVHGCGNCCGSAKLTKAEVVAIRESTESQRKLAPRYGVDHSTIWKIRRFKNWKTIV